MLPNAASYIKMRLLLGCAKLLGKFQRVKIYEQQNTHRRSHCLYRPPLRYFLLLLGGQIALQPDARHERTDRESTEQSAAKSFDAANEVIALALTLES